MPMYNLIECSDNCSDSSGSLWGFKREEIASNTNVTNDDNAPSFKYKANVIANTNADGTKMEVKIAVSLKYLRSCYFIGRRQCKISKTIKWRI